MIINTYFKGVMEKNVLVTLTKERYAAEKEFYVKGMVKNGHEFIVPKSTYLRSLVEVYGRSGLYPRRHFPTYVCGARWMKLLKFNGSYVLVEGKQKEEWVALRFDRITSRWVKFHVVRRAFSKDDVRRVREKCVNVEQAWILGQLWMGWKKIGKAETFAGWLEKSGVWVQVKSRFDLVKMHKKRMG